MADNKVKIVIETDAGRSEQVLDGVKKSLQGVEKQYKATAKESQSFSVSGGKNIIALAGSLKTLASSFAIATTAKEAFFAAKDAARFNEIALYAKNASESVGISFERMVEASRRGANGMASNVAIMQANLKALKLGLNASADEIGRLWEIANTASDELGQDITATYEQIVHAIVTGNSRALISLGVLSENFKRVSDSAELMGKRGNLLKDVLEQLGKRADELNKYGDTGYDKYQQLNTAFQNLKTTIGQQLTPAFETCVEWLTKIVKTGDKAIQVLGKVTLINNNKNNPFFAWNLDDVKAKITEARSVISASTINPANNSSTSYRTSNLNSAEAGLANSNRQADVAYYKEILPQLLEAETYLEKLGKKRAENNAKIFLKSEEYNKELDSSKKIAEAMLKLGGGLAVNFDKAAANAKKIEQEGLRGAIEKQKELNEEIEKTFKNFANLADTFMPQLIKDETDAYEIALNFAKAAGGIAVGFDKAAASAEKLAQEESFAFTEKQAQNAGYWNSFIQKSNQSQINDLLNATIGFSGLNISKVEIPEVAKKSWSAIQNQVIEGFSEAVTSGIINSNLGDALRGAISSIAATKAQSYGSNILGSLFSGKGIATGALSGFVGSIAVSAIANNWKKWFGSKGHAETENKNRSTVERMANAFLSTYSAMLNPYITPELENEMWNAKQGSTYVGWRYKTDWKGKRTYYDDTPQATFNTISRVENAVKKIEDYNKEKERELDLLSAQGKGYQVLSEQVSALSGAMDRAKYMLDEYSFTFSGNVAGAGTYKIDLSENIDNLKKAYYEALRQYGEETGARNQQKASTFLSLFPYLDDYDMGSYRSWFSRRKKEGNDNPAWAYSYISGAQENLLDRYADPEMLRMIQQAGLEQFNLASMQYSDGGSQYTKAYLNVLERQKAAAEYVMQQQEEIYLDMTKTFEEQQAALETYQAAQEQYYNTKLEILAQEAAKEEQIKKEEQQAKLRSAEKMEALLGFTGEIARTGNKIYILEGADQVGALRELEQQIDDPEALAIIQRLTTYAQNKNKFGKI